MALIEMDGKEQTDESSSKAIENICESMTQSTWKNSLKNKEFCFLSFILIVVLSFHSH